LEGIEKKEEGNKERGGNKERKKEKKQERWPDFTAQSGVAFKERNYCCLILLIAGCLVKGAAAVWSRVLRALLPLPHAADRAAPFGAGCASHSRRLSPRHSARGALASCSH
jgi:hypothetical protein